MFIKLLHCDKVEIEERWKFCWSNFYVDAFLKMLLFFVYVKMSYDVGRSTGIAEFPVCMSNLGTNEGTWK